MIDIFAEDEKLLLSYSPDASYDWIFQSFEIDGKVNIKKIFFFSKNDEVSRNDYNNSVAFLFGYLDTTKKYFVISGEKLNIPISVLFDRKINLKAQYFIAARNISIFKRITKIVKKNIIIGQDEEANLKFDTFQKLIKSFPNSTELDKYANMRISTVIREEIGNAVDSNKLYEKYMKNKISKTNPLPMAILTENETKKYTLIYKKLNKMLQEQDSYTEKIWQKEILDIIKLIFPKYVCVLKEVPIRDVYTNKTKRLDYLLVDYNGNIDIIEIKRPQSKPIVTDTKYRDNYVPLHELSGTIMQIEKYIFYLNKWSKAGEECLTEYCKKKTQTEIKVKIINPCAIIIMGRDENFRQEQMQDFEIIKRKYKNIVDIITYDDLSRRIQQLIKKI
jgi:hypothetical protein